MLNLKFWQKKRKPIKVTLDQKLELTGGFIIAIARLMGIDPRVLEKESKNHKANAEYILKMIK